MEGQVRKLTIFDCPKAKFFILLIIKIERGIILWATGLGLVPSEFAKDKTS